MTPITLVHEPIDYECKVSFTNGEKLLLNTAQLKPYKDLWTFPNWQCNAGTDLLLITADMTVYSCNLKNDNMGNLLDPDFSMFTEPTICKQATCQPKNMDLSCTKYSPSNN